MSKDVYIADKTIKKVKELMTIKVRLLVTENREREGCSVDVTHRASVLLSMFHFLTWVVVTLILTL